MKRIGVFLIATLGLAQANGGGYFRGGVESAGDAAGFEPEGTGSVAIVDEYLKIALGSAQARVDVRYLMRNETDDKVSVRFGFPVEESLDRPFGSGLDGAQPDFRPGNELKYCRNYRVEAGGREVSAKWEGERQPAEDGRFERIAGWLVSEVEFAAREEKVVRIGFDSIYSLGGRAVSDDSHEAAGEFVYRLSTGAAWAGPIGRGRVELLAAGVDPSDLRVLKPVNRFEKRGDRWVWEFEDLEPTLADDIAVEARPGVSEYWRRPDEPHPVGGEEAVRYLRRDEDWTMLHSNYRVRASSELPASEKNDYRAENVRDWKKAWSEGAAGSGTGEWLELEPEVAKPLEAIVLAPGYNESPALFAANARPRSILVTLNDEHEFRASIPDLDEEHRIAVLGYSKPVSKLRMVFDEVWPGERYEDLCVSYVGLEVAVDEKPEIRPSR